MNRRYRNAVHTIPLSIESRMEADVTDQKLEPGEHGGWTNRYPHKDCALCKAGLCRQFVHDGPMYRVPHIVHNPVRIH